MASKKANKIEKTSESTMEQTIASTENEYSPNETQTGLRLEDLVRLVEMIEIAYKRGTYSKFEVEAVQPSFDRASAFIKQIAQQNQSVTTDSESEQSSTTE